jgi:hypothetical protein
LHDAISIGISNNNIIFALEKGMDDVDLKFKGRKNLIKDFVTRKMIVINKIKERHNSSKGEEEEVIIITYTLILLQSKIH